jgi:glycosyltransferase involved in cell wall biosynthesis
VHNHGQGTVSESLALTLFHREREPIYRPARVTDVKAAPTIRVLHVINGEHYAGAERVQDYLALRLPAYGFEVEFACVKPSRFGPLRQSQRSILHDLPMRSRWDLRPVRRLVKLIRSRRCAIVHTHTPRTALLGGLAAALTGVRLVHHAHSPTCNDSTHRWHNRVNDVVERLSLRGVCRVIAVSESLAADVARRGFGASRIAVVHNGVPSLELLPERRPPSGVWTLGTTALFRPRKGLEVLLEAMAILHRQGCPAKLRAVGAFESPEYEAEIIRRTRQLGLSQRVTWTGFRRDIDAQLQKMDLFVLPSLFGEGLPMVVLEAMAAGVPVVATDVAGIPEAIRHGQDGLIVPPGDAEQLAAAVAGVVRGECDWSALRTSAVARQSQLFSDCSMASGVAQVYREVLAASYRRT